MSETETTETENLIKMISELREEILDKIVPEDKIQEMIDSRVSRVESDLRGELSSALDQIKEALSERMAVDTAYRTRLEAAQSKLSETVGQFVASTESKLSAVTGSVTELNYGVANVQTSLNMLKTLIEGRNDEIREIHNDVNTVTADVKKNREDIKRLDLDNLDFQRRAGDALAWLLGYNPYAPERTHILEPLPLRVENTNKRIDALSLKIDQINAPVTRLLELELRREKINCGVGVG